MVRKTIDFKSVCLLFIVYRVPLEAQFTKCSLIKAVIRLVG